jgi:hypothetical protein
LGFGIKEPGQTLPGFVIVIFTFLLFRTNDHNFSLRYFDNIFPGLLKEDKSAKHARE